MSNSNGRTCGKCASANPINSRYCQKCGNSLVVNCRKCGAENSLNSAYCNRCGVSIADAVYELSAARCERWDDHFSSFPGYATNWSDRVAAANKALQLKSRVEPTAPMLGKVALILPIRNKDWCIKHLTWGREKITSGVLTVHQRGLLACDFKREIARICMHEELLNGRLDGDVFAFNKSSYPAIKFEIRLSRPGTGSAIVQLLDILFSIGSGGSAIEHSYNADRIGRDTRALRDKREAADAFAESIFNLFVEICERKHLT